MTSMQKELRERICSSSCESFQAATFDKEDTMIAKEANSEIEEQLSNTNGCRTYQAEMEAVDIAR